MRMIRIPDKTLVYKRNPRLVRVCGDQVITMRDRWGVDVVVAEWLVCPDRFATETV
jgi:hypothetical protein